MKPSKLLKLANMATQGEWRWDDDLTSNGHYSTSRGMMNNKNDDVLFG